MPWALPSLNKGQLLKWGGPGACHLCPERLRAGQAAGPIYSSPGSVVLFKRGN